jgi:hypothetical protein
MKIFQSLLLACALGISSGAALDFVHPGTLSSRAELDYIKAKIQAGAQPWAGELEQIKASRYAKMGPHGLANINSKSEDADISRYDAAAAYSQALLWYFTGDETYARSAIAILNSWSDLQAFTAGTQQDRLQAGWIGAVLAPAAEIMRLYPGWSAAEIGKLQAMFRHAFYPQLITASTWNGNIDLTQIDAMIAIAVFNEDEALFRQGIERLNKRSRAYFYLTADGPLPHAIEGDNGDLKKFWYNPVKWVDGLSQETCRDNGHHAQYALGSALHAAETAWHQGVDVYTENQSRYTAALELLAQQFLAGSMLGVSSKDLPDHERYNTWEIGYNHYHNRVGLSLPFTQRLITEQIRTGSIRAIWNLNYETLTHADVSLRASPMLEAPR